MSFKNFALAGLLLFTIAIGASISLKSWNGMVYWYSYDGRNPAAIKKVFDFSHLEGSALKMASYKRLIADATIVEAPNSLGLELGHFVVKGKNNRRQFACDVYNKLELIFESADMSVSGAPSIMKVEANCEANEDINRIKTVWIPMEKILKEKEGDTELQILDKGKLLLSFSNIGDRWPRAWTLSKIRMYNEEDFNKILQINRKEMHEILSRPLTLVWDKDL